MTDDVGLKASIIDALESIEGPGSGRDIVDAGIVNKVEVKDGLVGITLLFEADLAVDARHHLEDLVYDKVSKLEGVSDLVITPTSKGGKKKALRIHGGDAPAQGGHDHAGHSHGPTQPPGKPAPNASTALQGVGQVIAVASGKGGVGKSTVAVNLALALKNLGYSVGLLDIDVYGPSLPTLLGVQARPAVRNKQIVPLEAADLRLMSLGFLLDEDTPVIWRGPIVTGIIRQFLQDVDWSGTDYLIVDMPPGTGDAQLSLAQTVPVDGAIVVTTPSDLALIDAARGLQMFRTLNVDVLGIVENMSHYIYPGLEKLTALIAELRASGADAAKLDQMTKVLDENSKLYIFGQDGGAREAARLDIPLIGQIPLDGDVRAGGDHGKPIVLTHPDGLIGKAFTELAKKVVAAKPAKKARVSPFAFSKS